MRTGLPFTAILLLPQSGGGWEGVRLPKHKVSDHGRHAHKDAQRIRGHQAVVEIAQTAPGPQEGAAHAVDRAVDAQGVTHTGEPLAQRPQGIDDDGHVDLVHIPFLFQHGLQGAEILG